jgi:L-amino acid N-acyltransferase YncA
MSLIRLADERDAEQIQAIYAPFCADNSPVSFETEPPTVEVIRQRIAKTLEKYPWLVCEEGSELLGYVYATSHRNRAAYRWSVDVSVYVREGKRRSGIGRALYTSLFNILRLQGFVNAFAGTTIPNPGSIGLHQAVGFEQVGIYRGVGHKGGAWHDTAWWQLPLQEKGTPPREPMSLESIRHGDGWESALSSGSPLLRQSHGRSMARSSGPPHQDSDLP